MKSIIATTAALSLGSAAYAASIVQTCPETDVCYSLNIPESTASSGNGDIYFQILAPTSYEWVGLGQGSSMTGANIFVMYTSSDGTNVTVSPRLGTGEVEPQYDTSTRITVLEGSGVSNGIMTANVLCSNCQSWSGGSMDFTSSSARWIYAIKSGSALNSDSLSETITQHDTASSFLWQISQAKGGSANVNPFVSSSKSSSTSSGGKGKGKGKTSSGGTSSSTTIPETCTLISSASSTTITAPSSVTVCPTTFPTQFSVGFPASIAPPWVTSCLSAGYTGHHSSNPHPTTPPRQKRDDGCPAGYEKIHGNFAVPCTGQECFATPGYLTLSERRHMSLAHGILASLAFVALFPIGGILVRLGSFKRLIWVHAALQCFAYFIYIIAFALGIYMATHLGLMNNPHPILGIALFFILLGQPIFAFLHHRLFKKYGHRSFWTYVHLFHGRIAILLGMVNGGLGLKLAGTASKSAKIAYAVITAIMAVIYIAAIVVGELRRRQRGLPSYDDIQKANELRDLSRSERNAPPTYQEFDARR